MWISEVLQQLGSVLMSLDQLTTEGHIKVLGLGCSLKPCLVSMSHAATRGYVDVSALCCHLRPWWCQSPCFCQVHDSAPDVCGHVTMEGYVDVHSLCWHLRPCWCPWLMQQPFLCPWSVLPPETILTSMAHADTRDPVVVCGLCCLQKPCRSSTIVLLTFNGNETTRWSGCWGGLHHSPGSGPGW